MTAAIAKKALVAQPHERRVQRFAFLALAAATALAIVLALRSPGRMLGAEVPLLAMLGLVLAGGVAGIVAVARRSVPVALAACAGLVLGVAPGGELAPGLAGYALGFLFGALVLCFGELVHMTQRYDVAHKLVEEEGVPEESLDRVTDEAVKTLATRAGAALGAAFSAAALALLLSAAGPRALREGLETAAPLGVAVLGLALALTASLYVLARGARLRGGEEATTIPIQEAAP